MPNDYNSTLNLPKTEFPMRANLSEKEPETLKYWEDINLYDKLTEKNKNKPSYILHDGPPYANGDIHLGHALNKILKDMVVKYKSMNGYNSPFVPGWDTHGLPTEIKARTKFGAEKSKQMSDIELRNLCKEFALGYVEKQKEQFKRLGVVGDWKNPYITLLPEYEAEQIRIFAEMASKEGTIYRGLRPVYWCPSCETALAEAEIEYQNDKCRSIYVKFKVSNDNGKLSALGADLDKTYFIIWTTTDWTLPGNVAVCVGKDFEYSLVKNGDEFYILADSLVSKVMAHGKVENYEIIAKIPGADLEFMEADHPFLNRKSLVIVGDHVTVESGTGCVHTAPGHGMEDFEVCKNYKNLPVIVPVNSKGILTSEAGEFSGLDIHEAGSKICDRLKENNLLFASKTIDHQYPHCWRCKSQIIFRATKQWFCSVEQFKKEALDAVETVKWNPAWGKERMISMLSERKDWCISRQRVWGVPIPIFFCKDCGKELINKEIMMHIADIFEKEGSDSWYTHNVEYFLPQNATCSKCGGHHFVKEKDIMDVWFDSGTSYAAVCDKRPELSFPADLYLEGADQYRGWFQSSLLTSVAAKGCAPYKNIVTHGWVVDEEGRKQSKSQGNGVEPGEVVDKYGADVLRLWVSSADYHTDVKMSHEILKQLSEAYRKIRNTARFIMGNLYDFDPDKDTVNPNEFLSLDKWAIAKLNEVTEKVMDGYKTFEFHNVYHTIQKFCIVDMSNFYLDVLKDRLYVEKADSIERRTAQSTIYLILNALVKMIAPVLSYTAEEIWKYMPHLKTENTESVFLNDMNSKADINIENKFIENWDKIHKIRDEIKKVLEIQRKDKIIGSSLEAEVTIYAKEKPYKFINDYKEDLQSVLIVSGVKVEKEGKGDYVLEGIEGLSISINHSKYGKCERCWTYSESVGKDKERPTICKRCIKVLE